MCDNDIAMAFLAGGREGRGNSSNRLGVVGGRIPPHSGRAEQDTHSERWAGACDPLRHRTEQPEVVVGGKLIIFN